MTYDFKGIDTGFSFDQHSEAVTAFEIWEKKKYPDGDTPLADIDVELWCEGYLTAQDKGGQ